MKKITALVLLLLSLSCSLAFAHEGGAPHHHNEGEQGRYEQTK